MIAVKVSGKGVAIRLQKLLRTFFGFAIEAQIVDENKAADYILPIEKALAAYEKIVVTSPQANRFKNGGDLDYNRLHGEYSIGIYRVYSPEMKFLGLGEILEEKGNLMVKRVLVSDE
mgnify:CR=1 FL=1